MAGSGPPTPDGDLVYALDVYVDEGGDAPVQVLDLATDTWSDLPLSPHQPKLDQRTLVATPLGLVVMGDDFLPRQPGRNQEDAHAERWDGTTWRRFPDSEVQGCCWHWTGERIISTYRLTQKDSDRGGLHTFRAGALDPATGEWTALPCLPDGDRGLLLEPGWPTANGPARVRQWLRLRRQHRFVLPGAPAGPHPQPRRPRTRG